MIQADFMKMFQSKWIKIGVAGMLAVAIGMILMQKTAMDYEVQLDRVLFLPMTMYGIASAVLVSMICGSDYDGGFIRNKIFAGSTKRNIYLSNELANLAGGLVMYVVTFVFTLLVGVLNFECNITISQICGFWMLGLLTCVTYICIYFMISMLVGHKATAAVICMILAFAMLFMGMYSNTIFIQNDNANLWQEFMFDCNPTGQMAQVSAMKCLNPVRFVILDIVWVLLTNVIGIHFFQKKELK